MNPDTPLLTQTLPEHSAQDPTLIRAVLQSRLKELDRKIIVLDDDPTGMQAVHGVSIYTDWDISAIRQGFAEKGEMFFVLTNSRSFTRARAEQVHREIARNIVAVSRECGRKYIIISRSDSTLRGHYPYETEALRQEMEQLTGQKIDGEIIVPFFSEGGRITMDNVHYVKDGDSFVPVSGTEFARDTLFPYTSSHLGEWCEEKTNGHYKAADMIYITLESLRHFSTKQIVWQLEQAADFNKIIVNAVDYSDLETFLCAYSVAVGRGKTFLFRSAASLTKALGGIPDKPLLRRVQLIQGLHSNGGLVVVASPSEKTTLQLEMLHLSRLPVLFIEFNQHLVEDTPGQLEKELERVIVLTENGIANGHTVVLHTRRKRVDAGQSVHESQLILHSKISKAITQIVSSIHTPPAFLLAKGGTTASDVISGALNINRVSVMGQISPGVPVWMTGVGCRFPDMPFIIFPGNVGDETTLRDVVAKLLEPPERDNL